MDLRRLRVASPCTAPWDEMTGDERRRFCDACGKHVHNLEEMRQDEVRALLRDLRAPLCIRVARDRAGTLHFADGPLLPPPRRVPLRAAALALAVAACDPGAQECPPAPAPAAAPAEERCDEPQGPPPVIRPAEAPPPVVRPEPPAVPPIPPTAGPEPCEPVAAPAKKPTTGKSKKKKPAEAPELHRTAGVMMMADDPF